MHKKIIRKAVIKKRNLINQNAWKLHSSIVCKRIIHKINLLNKKIGIYFPINNEVSILELCNFAKCKKYFPKIKNNKINFCEYFSEKKIHYLELLKKPKQFNLIFENKTFNPKIAKNILIPEIIFIPLVAFNEKCFRVGYGGGFYDKYLANKSIIKIGVAFEFQKIEFTPEKHDIQLNYIFTEKKVYHGN
jgi:5-formyltetrahydrofolate cyclo-ligase